MAEEYRGDCEHGPPPPADFPTVEGRKRAAPISPHAIVAGGPSQVNNVISSIQQLHVHWSASDSE